MTCQPLFTLDQSQQFRQENLPAVGTQTFQILEKCFISSICVMVTRLGIVNYTSVSWPTSQNNSISVSRIISSYRASWSDWHLDIGVWGLTDRHSSPPTLSPSVLPKYLSTTRKYCKWGSLGWGESWGEVRVGEGRGENILNDIRDTRQDWLDCKQHDTPVTSPCNKHSSHFLSANNYREWEVFLKDLPVISTFILGCLQIQFNVFHFLM